MKEIWKKVSDSLFSPKGVPFDEIVEGAQDSILVVHVATGGILYANPAIETLVGYTPAELLGLSFAKICLPEMLGYSAEKIADAWEKGGASCIELKLKHKLGAIIPVELSVRVGPFSKQPAAILYIRDIRERLRLQQLIEEQNRQIIENVEYAHRLQTAALPTPQEVAALFPSNFVLYQPSRIVSGDFYWVGEKSGRQYFFVGDCTGHGVSGAMMVMLTLAFLQQGFQRFPSPQPSNLLQYIHCCLYSALDPSKTKDGAEAILICVDKEEDSLIWASAGRPLWYLSGGELHEHKGDRHSLGGSTAPDYQWNDYTLKLSQIKRIILSTDGYPSQIGGPSQRKLTVGRFKKVIQETATLSLSQQKEALVDFLEKWKGAIQQVDDILVVGIEFSPNSNHA
ncbi:MAG: SpoIIE family protein phosphatase [Bacteroidia bacterium]|nr:SpoIIE family protein phosphatase [Bacteroidia bacterium]MDW8235678.1 SpoIIE family protein phosphatase [Bacteroidia bacterium]